MRLPFWLCTLIVLAPPLLGIAFMALMSVWLGAAIIVIWFALLFWSLSEGWP